MDPQAECYRPDCHHALEWHNPCSRCECPAFVATEDAWQELVDEQEAASAAAEAEAEG